MIDRITRMLKAHPKSFIFNMIGALLAWAIIMFVYYRYIQPIGLGKSLFLLIALVAGFFIHWLLQEWGDD